MDQKKIGSFMQELRLQKGLTQEQLAEILGVSNRSVSRWETGTNMPDFDLLIEIARQFGVGVEELLDGARKERPADAETERALIQAVDYGNDEKLTYSRRQGIVFFAGALAILAYMVIDGLELGGAYKYAADFMLGLVFGILLTGGLYTCRFMAKVRTLKRKLLKRGQA